MILFLDDDPNRAAITYQRWSPERTNRTIWCHTAQETIDTLRDYSLAEVHLDHDLEGPQFLDPRHQNSGMEVVRWIEAQPELSKFADTLFIIHSHHLRAGFEMLERLENLRLRVKYIPFGFMREIALR